MVNVHLIVHRRPSSKTFSVHIIGFTCIKVLSLLFFHCSLLFHAIIFMLIDKQLPKEKSVFEDMPSL